MPFSFSAAKISSAADSSKKKSSTSTDAPRWVWQNLGFKDGSTSPTAKAIKKGAMKKKVYIDS